MADGHTSLVRGARLLLPVAALGLMSTMFLAADRVDPDDAIPFAEVDVSMRARDQQLTAPRFAGVSQGGAAFAITAARARPDQDDPRRMTAEAVALDVVDPSQATLALTAGLARIDTATRSLSLEDGVRIVTSTGYDINAPRMHGRLDRLDVGAEGGVSGTGPLGDLSAEAMRLTEDADGAQRLLFTGGVDLLYVPPVP
jgi:lipopolysaccharide export system protein LptC